jgi:hypothetical protein
MMRSGDGMRTEEQGRSFAWALTELMLTEADQMFIV